MLFVHGKRDNGNRNPTGATTLNDHRKSHFAFNFIWHLYCLVKWIIYCIKFSHIAFAVWYVFLWRNLMLRNCYHVRMSQGITPENITGQNQAPTVIILVTMYQYMYFSRSHEWTWKILSTVRFRVFGFQKQQLACNFGIVGKILFMIFLIYFFHFLFLCIFLLPKFCLLFYSVFYSEITSFI